MHASQVYAYVKLVRPLHAIGLQPAFMQQALNGCMLVMTTCYSNVLYDLACEYSRLPTIWHVTEPGRA